jgi:YidC/Oxa1 family membrane protein insertase
MELWTIWIHAIQGILDFLSSQFGLSAGCSIVVMTLLLRAAVLPLTWSSAYRASIRGKKMLVLQPELDRLKRVLSDRPRAYAVQAMKLYSDHGVTVMDWRGLMGAVVQAPLMLGVFQTLKAGVSAARFLWVKSLASPDPWFAILAGITTMLVMLANPDLPDTLRLLLIAVPSVLAMIAALKVCSALAVYWSVSSGFAALQTYVMHYVIRKRIKSGAILI